jgi:uncharacterized protein
VRILDVNLLLYALDETSPRPRPRQSVAGRTLSGSETVGFSWQVLIALVD